MTRKLDPKRVCLWWAVAAGAAGLTACGGGGGGGGSAATPPASTNVTLAGVVSNGATPEAGRTVTAKCAVGSGSVTTGADGSYNLTVSAANLPCLLEAVAVDGTVLHSVAQGSGTTATANITPFTELVVASLAGGDTAAYYRSFDATAAAAVTSTSVASAVTAATPAITATGVSGSVASSALTGTVDSSYTAALGTYNTATPPLPANLVLQPKAATCPTFAKGTYRAVFATSSSSTAPTATVDALDTVTFDPATLTATYADGSSDTLTTNGTCRFATSGGTEFVVSPTGVLVGRSNGTVLSPGTYRMFIGLPVQTVPLAELAGTWNTLEWAKDGGTYSVLAATGTISSSGAFTSASCENETLASAASACTTATSLLPVLSVNPGGGFDLNSTDPGNVWKSRGFAYRSGKGDLMMVFLAPEGGLTLMAPVRTLTLPAVNEASANWNVDTNVNGVSPALSARTHTVVSVDNTTGSYVRDSTTVGTTSTRPETITYNNARQGYFHRTPATVNDSNGTPVTVREFYALSLQRNGLSAVYVPNTASSGTSNALFELSVQQ